MSMIKTFSWCAFQKGEKKTVCELISYVGEVVDPRSSTSMNQDAGQHFDWRLNVFLFYFSSFSGFKIASVLKQSKEVFVRG